MLMLMEASLVFSLNLPIPFPPSSPFPARLPTLSFSKKTLLYMATLPAHPNLFFSRLFFSWFEKGTCKRKLPNAKPVRR